MVAKSKITRNTSKKGVASNRGAGKTTNKKYLYEPDTTFFLKAVVFLILGSQWIYIEQLPEWQLPIPVGLIIGLVFATHDHFRLDRKIEYVVLLFATFISFWLPMGIVISL